MLIILIILICVYFGFKYGFSEIKTDSKKQDKLEKIPVKEEDKEIDIDENIIIYSSILSNSLIDSTHDCSGMDSHSCECHGIDSHNCDL